MKKKQENPFKYVLIQCNNCKNKVVLIFRTIIELEIFVDFNLTFVYNDQISKFSRRKPLAPKICIPLPFPTSFSVHLIKSSNDCILLGNLRS